jgi:hypothetical protein
MKGNFQAPLGLKLGRISRMRRTEELYRTEIHECGTEEREREGQTDRYREKERKRGKKVKAYGETRRGE